MSRLRSVLTMGMVPASTDVGLLVLRVWLGLSMAVLHGWGKLGRLSADPIMFADPFGLGPGPSLMMAAAAEFIAALLVVIGLGTRWAALALAINMGTAFVAAHGAALSGEQSGELAFVYLAAFVVMFCAGAGKYSVDARLR